MWCLVDQSSGSSGSIALSSLNVAMGLFWTEWQSGDYSGSSVNGAGDINGDGVADLHDWAPYEANSYAGASYVVFGEPGMGSNGSIMPYRV